MNSFLIGRNLCCLAITLFWQSKNMSLVYISISIRYGVSGLEVTKVVDTKMEFTVRYTRQITALVLSKYSTWNLNIVSAPIVLFTVRYTKRQITALAFFAITKTITKIAWKWDCKSWNLHQIGRILWLWRLKSEFKGQIVSKFDLLRST